MSSLWNNKAIDIDKIDPANGGTMPAIKTKSGVILKKKINKILN